MPIRLIALATMCALVASGCGGSGESAVTTPPEPAEATALEASTQTSAEASVEATGEPPASPQDETAMINWSEAGVVVRTVDGQLRSVSDEAATAAVLFDDGTAVYQPAPDLIVVQGASADREIRSDPEYAMQLLDGRDSHELRMILVTSWVVMPVGPDDAEERLLFINIDTGVRYDLGVIGGWESSVRTGRFTDNAIALIRTNAADLNLVLLDHNGLLRHDVYLGTDQHINLTALSPGDEVAVFRGGTMTLVDAWTGEEQAAIAGEWPCIREVRAVATHFYCAQENGPARVALGTLEATPMDWAPTGMVAPAVQPSNLEQVLDFGDQRFPTGLRQVGLSPDGAFRYFVDEVGTSQPVPILVDDGSGLRPAMADKRDQYRLYPWRPDAVQLEFVNATTVIWTATDTSSGTMRYFGRIDSQGMIRDIIGGLFTESLGIDDYEVFAVTTSGVDLNIDVDKPLLDLMEEDEQPLTGGWYLGDTLAKKRACGAKTLYRTTADGFGRILPPGVELDEVVDVDATPRLTGLNIDSVSTNRFVAISVRCPDAYEGVRVYLLSEWIGYGDNGPRSGPFAEMFVEDSIGLTNGTETFAAVTGIVAFGQDCLAAPHIEIGLETLAGERLVAQIPEWDATSEPWSFERRELQPPTPEQIRCDD